MIQVVSHLGKDKFLIRAPTMADAPNSLVLREHASGTFSRFPELRVFCASGRCGCSLPLNVEHALGRQHPRWEPKHVLCSFCGALYQLVDTELHVTPRMEFPVDCGDGEG